MSCVLRVMGEFLDVDLLTERIGIRPYLIWRKGEKRSASGRIHERSGVFYLASDAEMTEIPRQVLEATEYLKENTAEIAAVASFPGVTKAVLNFGGSLNEGDFAQSYIFSASFLKLVIAAGLEVEVTYYAYGSDGAES